MQVRARFFAAHRERAGIDRVSVDVPEGTTVLGLVELVAKRFPELGPMLGTTRYAVNREYASPTTVLQNGDEVAFIPPVAGGES